MQKPTQQTALDMQRAVQQLDDAEAVLNEQDAALTRMKRLTETGAA